MILVTHIRMTDGTAEACDPDSIPSELLPPLPCRPKLPHSLHSHNKIHIPRHFNKVYIRGSRMQGRARQELGMPAVRVFSSSRREVCDEINPQQSPERFIICSQPKNHVIKIVQYKFFLFRIYF